LSIEFILLNVFALQHHQNKIFFEVVSNF